MQFWALIVDSFRESKDRKIFWVMFLLSLLVGVGMMCINFRPNEIDLCFGMAVIKTDAFSTAEGLRYDLISAVLIGFFMDAMFGVIGIILCIVATGGFIPSFMERGVIDLTLSKPISRPLLFLGRYIGSLTFVAAQATFFVILTFLVAGLRWHIWVPGYLLSIPLMLFFFSLLYCVSALVGTVTRSPVAAILLTLGVWIAAWAVQRVDDTFEYGYPEWQQYQVPYRAIHVARWILPKTMDITRIAKRWSGAADASNTNLNEQEIREPVARAAIRAEIGRSKVSAFSIIGSSLLFEVGVVLIAMFKFSRTDY